MVKRLNLGCGHRKLDGYINIDFPVNYSGEKPDVECDIRVLPYDDESVDEVLAVHVLEHFPVWDAGNIIDEWIRVLKPGGSLVIEVPCLDKVISLFVDPMGTEVTQRELLCALYGDWEYQDEKMIHKWCWSRNQLRDLLGHCGLEVQEQEPQFHRPYRDIRMVGRKC